MYIVPPNDSEDIATWLAVDTSVGNTGGGVDLSPQARLRLARAEGFHEVARAGPMRLLRRALPPNPLCAQVD